MRGGGLTAENSDATVSWSLEETTLIKLRHVCSDPRPLKRELAARLLGTNAAGATMLTEQGVEYLFKQV